MTDRPALIDFEQFEGFARFMDKLRQVLDDREGRAAKMLPRPGDKIRLDGDASPQFSVRPITFRVTRVQDWETYDGWVWLHGYELDDAGEAVELRDVYVRIDGLPKRPGPPRGTPRK